MRQRPVRTAAALPAAAILAAACAGPPEQPEPRPLEGCHYFVQDAVHQDLRLPWGVRLLDQPLEGWPALQQREGVRRATTLTGTDEVGVPFGYWIRTAQDSVEIGYPAGGGIRLRLAVHEAGFTGVAQPVGDAMPPPAAATSPGEHAVELIWARCPEE